jgi:hypothetical protein
MITQKLKFVQKTKRHHFTTELIYGSKRHHFTTELIYGSKRHHFTTLIHSYSIRMHAHNCVESDHSSSASDRVRAAWLQGAGVER